MSQLLIDLGTCMTKVGIAGEGNPQTVLYSCYEPNGDGYRYSEQCESRRLLFDDLGQISDMHAMQGFITQILSGFHEIEKVSLLMPGRTHRRDCERIKEYLSDSGVHVNIDQTSPYELYSQGLMSGLLVSLGDCGACAQLVDKDFDTFSAFQGQSGRLITRLLQQQLLELNDILVEEPLIHHFKELLAVPIYQGTGAEVWLKDSVISSILSQTGDFGLDKLENPETNSLTLPTGEELQYYDSDIEYISSEIGNEAPESKLSIFQILHENIFKQYSRMHIQQIAKNIVLAGGSSTIQNIDSLILRYFQPKILYKPENSYQASLMRFRGASVIAAIAQFAQ